MAQYLLESSLCLFIFYSFYYWQLRKETFFQLNRVYLIVTPALSLLIPWLTITLSATESTSAVDFVLPIIHNAEQFNYALGQQLEQPTAAFTLTLGDMLLIVYACGALFMAWRLVSGLWNLSLLIRKNTKHSTPDCTLIETNHSFPASSFFSYVFWKTSAMSEEEELILEHEKVHIRQWHTLDVLLIELMVILKWFNPLIYLFRNALKTTHEYIADSYIIQNRSNVRQYASLLVNSAKLNQMLQLRLTNSFYSLTKKRLQMMLQKQSSRWKLWKYFAALPMILVLMLLFSFNLSDNLPGGKKITQVSEYLTDLGEKEVFTFYDEVAQMGKMKLQWGDFEIPIFKTSTNGGVKGNIILDKKDFEKLLQTEISYIEEDITHLVSKFSLNLVFKPNNAIPANWFDHSDRMYINFNNKFNAIKAAEIYDWVDKGYPNFQFIVEIGDGEEYPKSVVFEVAVILPRDIWYPNVNLKDFKENEGVFNFQLVNQEGKPTLIKMDTTNAKYNWMYEDYKGNPEVLVVHIPDFKTVQRVITLDDVVFKERELTSNLATGIELKVHQFPDFYDFDKNEISLTWRGAKGTLKSSLSELSSFKKSKVINPIINVGDDQYHLLAAEVYFVHQNKKEKWIINDWGEHKFLEKIKNLETRTSIYLSNILMEDSDGEKLRFPMSFAFNLANLEDPGMASHYSCSWGSIKPAVLGNMPAVNPTIVSLADFKKLYLEEPVFYNHGEPIEMKEYKIRVINSFVMGREHTTSYYVNQFNPFEQVQKELMEIEIPRLQENEATIIINGITADDEKIDPFFICIGALNMEHFPKKWSKWYTFLGEKEILGGSGYPDFNMMLEKGNPNKEAQYWKSDLNGTIFHYQNYPMGDLIEKLAQGHKSNLELIGFADDELFGFILESENHPPADDPYYFEKQALQFLKKRRYFKEEKIKEERDVYKLIVKDAEKLKPYKVLEEDLNEKSDNYSNSKFLIDANYTEILKSLDRKNLDVFLPENGNSIKDYAKRVFDIYLDYDDSYQDEYFLGIEGTSFESFRATLESEFGLELVKEKRELEITQIISQKSIEVPSQIYIPNEK